MKQTKDKDASSSSLSSSSSSKHHDVVRNFFTPTTSASVAVNTALYTPWVEKYRPKTVDDISHQDEVVRILKKSIESGNLPHLLFYGPPGTGKTSTILAISKDLYGSDTKQFVMELNASDERGIDVVRHKIKNFAQLAVPSSGKAPTYKLVILDEADAMTNDAQTALRRTMEAYSRTTRFCLICNYISRIIEPLASRCAKFRFKSLAAETMKERIQYICKEEKVLYSDELLETLAQLCLYMRKAITYLQSAHKLFGEELNEDCIIEIAGVVPQKILAKLLVGCRSNSFDKLQQTVEEMFMEGYPAAQIISQLSDFLATTDELTNLQKSKIAIKLGETDKCLVDGADEFLQMMDMCATIMYNIV